MISRSYIQCTGPGDGCPICNLIEENKPKERVMLNLIEPGTGSNKIMGMNETKLSEMFDKVFPKGKSWSFRVGNLEVTFWWMWRSLSWRDKRKGTAAGFSYWMFGPWEFRKYW